jgi:glycogen debranching enzyme
MTVTILEGSTFCVSDEGGDVAGGVHGVFAEDTRMVSTWHLLLDGAATCPVTSCRVGHFGAVHRLRNAPTETLAADTISVSRERLVDDGVTERLAVRNECTERLAFELELDLAADFADVISVKEHALGIGDQVLAGQLPEPARGTATSSRSLELSDSEGYVTRFAFSRDPTYTSAGVAFSLDLDSHETWELTTRVDFGSNASLSSVEAPFEARLERARDALSRWQRPLPRLTTTWRHLHGAYHRSIVDLASLRMTDVDGTGPVPAAGAPWFMTVFGRDTLLTSMQTLLLGPELALGSLRVLAALQATNDDPTIDAEPGKILHELRRGKAAEAWFPVYYGSLDSTPLFLILLSEVWRWSGDDSVALELEAPARRALEWLRVHGDRDGDGFLEYERRTPRGLVNQSWKDSTDSQCFHDARLAVPPIAPVEVQGYAFDARLRVAELAREAWADTSLARRLEQEAYALRDRFDDAFWIEERECYALALDQDKRPVDSLCSNIGHLLWSGIVPQEKRAIVARTLLSTELWSGWGLRTMATSEAAYNPLRYHNGTVWPHDTALAAWGLEREGFVDEAVRLARGLLDAAAFFDYSLPEAIAGYSRSETELPVAYPTAAHPQAWAAAAPILCLQLMLGVHPDRSSSRIVDSTREVSTTLDGTRLEGLRALGKVWTLTVENGRTRARHLTDS